MNDFKTPLNKTQLEILKLFSQPLSEQELYDIKSLLVRHLSEKFTKKIGNISDKKGYTEKDFDSWLSDPKQ
ncbi:MAG: hypothetical protein H0W62_03560 [Chitinophagales bacterium]|nr:hypothetical protein [Chitinophagales bacterium]